MNVMMLSCLGEVSEFKAELHSTEHEVVKDAVKKVGSALARAVFPPRLCMNAEMLLTGHCRANCWQGYVTTVP